MVGGNVYHWLYHITHIYIYIYISHIIPGQVMHMAWGIGSILGGEFQHFPLNFMKSH